jgi:hypothetical protein
VGWLGGAVHGRSRPGPAVRLIAQRSLGGQDWNCDLTDINAASGWPSPSASNASI